MIKICTIIGKETNIFNNNSYYFIIRITVLYDNYSNIFCPINCIKINLKLIITLI